MIHFVSRLTARNNLAHIRRLLLFVCVFLQPNNVGLARLQQPHSDYRENDTAAKCQGRTELSHAIEFSIYQGNRRNTCDGEHGIVGRDHDAVSEVHHSRIHVSHAQNRRPNHEDKRNIRRRILPVRPIARRKRLGHNRRKGLGGDDGERGDYSTRPDVNKDRLLAIPFPDGKEKSEEHQKDDGVG